IREHGLEAFEALVSQALPLSAYLGRELCRRVDLATPEGRARIQAELKPLVKAMPDVALRTQIVLEVAGKAGVEAGELLRYLGLRVASPPPAAPVGRTANWHGAGAGGRAERGGERSGGFPGRDGSGAGFAARRGQGGFGGPGTGSAWSRGPASLRSRA